MIHMVGKSVILGMVMVWMLHSAAQADMPVRVRQDGKIIDDAGKIIAVQNTLDNRNTLYEKYYTNIGPDGKPGTNSDFYIVADQNAGFLRKEIAAATTPSAAAPGAVSPPLSSTPAASNQVTSRLELKDDPNAAAYDSLSATESPVYGD